MTATTTDTQQTRVPYGSTNDCASVGLCSVYCHRWCNVFSPPSPPPIEFDGESSVPNLSPIAIAVIGILVSAFLLFSYYAIISRYYGSFESLRYRLHGPSGEDGREYDGGNHGHFRRDQAWQAAPSDGLDESLINKITVYKYRRGNGVVDGTDCPVCLNEFRDGESLRLLPRCSHAFHLRCIDTWLKSHSNCPLCRSNISWPNCTPPPPQLPLPAEAEACEGRRDVEIVVVIEEDLVIGVEEEEHRLLPNSGDVPKDQSKIQRTSGGAEVHNVVADVREDIVEPVRRSFSLDSSARGRVSMADVLLRTSAKDELMAASPSRREHAKENSKSRVLHCVMSRPVAMKRSTSTAGRFCLTRNGK